MSYLIDTCIISKLRKISKQPDSNLGKWIKKHHESAYFISVLTVGEIQLGISKLNSKNKEEKKKKLILEDWFNEELIPRFQNRILPINVDVVFEWGKLSGTSKQQGVNIPVVDGLIAATALVHNLTVVTDNVDDFIKTGARIYNPMEFFHSVL